MAGKRWNGSAWVDHTTKKRWNGSSWVDLTIAKRWNGSAWVDIYTGGGVLTFVPTPTSVSRFYFCTEPNVCPMSKTFTTNITYVVGGNTGAYTVVATAVGDSVSIDNATLGQIGVTATCGRTDTKTGELKVVVTDTVTSATFYIPYTHTYLYETLE